MPNFTAEIAIAAEPTDVAAVMFDPNRDPEWLSVVDTVDVLDPGIRPGARVRRTGTVLGRPLAWTTEVVAFHFPHVLNLRIIDGSLRGTLSYGIVRSPGGSTARLRASFELDDEQAAASPGAAEPSLDTVLAADLGRLQTLVEAPSR